MLFGQTLDYRKHPGGAARPDRRARPAPALPGPGYRPIPAPTCGRPTPTPAATSARCCRWTRRWPSSTPGSPAASASTAATALTLPVVEAGRGQAQVQSAGQLEQGRPGRPMSAEHDLPAHPLVGPGLSVDWLLALHQAGGGGRAMSAPAAGPGQDKTECGIHVARAPGRRQRGRRHLRLRERP